VLPDHAVELENDVDRGSDSLSGYWCPIAGDDRAVAAASALKPRKRI
jgi:hypothetical protein